MGGVFSTATWIFPDFIIHIFFGKSSIEAEKILKILSIAMTIFSAVNVLFNFFMARNLFSFLIPNFIIFIATLLGIYFFWHESPEQIASGFLIGVLNVFC